MRRDPNKERNGVNGEMPALRGQCQRYHYPISQDAPAHPLGPTIPCASEPRPARFVRENRLTVRPAGELEGRTRPPAILFFQRWAINTLAVLVATHVVSGIHYDTVTSLFVASLLFGILTTFLRPLLFVLTLPLVVLTLGLFVFVINAGLLYLVGSLVKDFRVDGFWPAFWGQSSSD